MSVRRFASRGSIAISPIVHERGHALERKRGHVVIAGHHGRCAALPHGNAGDALAVAQDLLHLRAEPVLDAAGLELREPRVDPDEVRRPVEDPVGRARGGIDDREHQLYEDVADRARAGLPGLGSDERARDSRGEELLVGGGALLRVDEVPPVRLLVLADPARIAGREDLPDARAEEREVVGRQARDRPEREEDVPQHRAGVARRAREERRDLERRLLVLRDPDPRRRHQMVRHLAPVERRDPAHRVDHVLVEAWEEAEAVLAGQPMLDRRDARVRELVAAPALTAFGHRDASSLAAGQLATFENDDLEAALAELVRGAHACDAAAENDDLGQRAGPPVRRGA